jgi:hypothetical protein
MIPTAGVISDGGAETQGNAGSTTRQMPYRSISKPKLGVMTMPKTLVTAKADEKSFATRQYPV